MRDLANADLVRFTIDRIDQMQVIVAKLVTVASQPSLMPTDSQRDGMAGVVSI